MPTAPLTLDSATSRRIVQLARKAGCTTEEMLQFVLRDGFTATAEDVREAGLANAELDAGGAIPHDVAMRRARAAVERHARKHSKAA